MAIRVVLAEDNALLREGISRLISSDDYFDLVGVGSDYPELIGLIETHEPDVVVTDIRMPPTGTDEGIRAAAWLRENHPKVGVVVLSQYTAPAYALALLEEGSAGRAYLLKERVAGAERTVTRYPRGRRRRIGDRPTGGRRTGEGPFAQAEK